MPKRVFIAGLAAFAIIGAILWVPWGTEKRTLPSSTAVPPALFGITPAPLGAGQTACLEQVTMDKLSQVGQIGAQTGGKPGPRLSITATGPGYRATSKVDRGYTDDAAIQFALTPPPEALIGKLCIRNDGPGKLSLNGTNEFRTMGRPVLTIDGAPQPYDAQLAFYARQPASYLARAGATFRHAATFTPGFLPRSVIALLALLALVGIPAGTIGALALALRSDEQAAEPPA
jgi:hypothetical protein